MTNTWGTPQHVFDRLSAVFGPFDVDVAAEAGNAKCDLYFDVEQDGLRMPWLGRVFCNPPYDDIAPWVKKALEATTEGKAESVTLLLPVRTDQKWWHEEVMHRAEVVCWVQGRISFVREGKKNCSFEPSMVVRFCRNNSQQQPQFSSIQFPKQGRLT
jgi:phage N-6-adenine-methyltransferase